MFSGIQSLIFGKKHHQKNHQQTVDDSALNISTSPDHDFVMYERRHSDDGDVTPSLYPTINPPLPLPGGALPYGISPSLPDLRPSHHQKATKEGHAVDFLHGVPFELASYIDILSTEKEEKFLKLLQRFGDHLKEDDILEEYSYDFDLENRILNEFQT